MNLRTPAFERFVDPARSYPAIWRILLGLVLFAVVYGLVTGGTVFLAFITHPSRVLEIAAGTLMTGNTRLSMTLILLSFAGMVIGTVLATVLLHKRTVLSLFGPINPMMRHFMIAVVVFFALNICIYGIWSLFYDGIPQRSFISVLIFMPIAAALILLQTGAEELLFRGYLLQQLGARFKSPIIWFLIPPVVFGLLHYNPQMMGDLAWMAVITITLTGLLWTDLTRVTGNIGAAWGWHFANNFMLMNFLGNKGELNGYVYMTTPYSVAELPPSLLFVDMGIAIATWMILRRLLRD